MSNIVSFFCQKCGKKIPEKDAKQVVIPNGQQKGLVLQLCPICSGAYNRPNFLNRAIYK